MTRFTYNQYLSLFRSSGTRSAAGAEGAVRSYSFTTGYGKRCVAWRRADGSVFVTAEPQEEVAPIVAAIKKGDVKKLKELVESCEKSLAEGNGDGWLPLHEAAHCGQEECVQMLLNARPELVDKRTLKEQTALLLAVAANHVACARCLLEAGADPNIGNKHKETPLYTACEQENVEAVKLILSFGGGVNQRCSQGWTALHEAAGRNNTHICQILLEGGANVGACNVYGVTPLFLAAQSGQVEASQFLINNGADVNSSASDGATPLYEACRNGHLGVVELLLCHNADANKPAKSGLMPLHMAAQHGCKDIVSHLIPVTSKARVRHSGISPLHLAAEHNEDEVLQLLIQAGFDVNVSLSRERRDLYEDRRLSPLYFAVANGNVESLEALLQAGAEPDRDPFSALLVAARQGCRRSVSLLLQHGANPNASIPTHPTCFPAVSLFCVRQLQLLKLLLDAGCDTKGFFSCRYGQHPPQEVPLHARGFNSHTLRFGCDGQSFGFSENTEPLQFCEMISSPTMSRWAGPVIDLLLDYVGNVILCSRLSQQLDSYEEWAGIKEKSSLPRPLMQLCRIRIREQLGRRRLTHLTTLPLPERLIKYLKHDCSTEEG